MDIVLNASLLGLCASVLTEIAKYFPLVRNNEMVKSLVAILMVAGVAYVSGGYALTFQSFALVMAFAFLNYKIIVQPVAGTLSLGSRLP